MEQSAGEQGDKQEDNSKQIEEYSEGVKKRIAKLTKRMREAERQKKKLYVMQTVLKRKETNLKLQQTL